MIACPYCDKLITYLDVEDQWDLAENPHGGFFSMPCPKCHAWLDVEAVTTPTHVLLFLVSRKLFGELGGEVP